MIRRVTICLCIAVCSFLITSSAGAAVLTIPAVKAEPGEAIELPVKIDSVDNLAGVKLAMTYNTKLLTFKEAEKTPATSSLMHIVNDKHPGRLIVVMAGARGIGGKDLSILTLRFQVKPEVTPPAETRIEITEVQLMSDQLKDIPYEVRTGPIRIAAAEADASAGEADADRKPAETEEKADSAGADKSRPDAEPASEAAEPTDSAGDAASETAP